MYIVKALTNATGFVSPDNEVRWSTNDIRVVADECIDFYQKHTDAFTVLAGPVMVQHSDYYTILAANGLAIQRDPGLMAAAYIDFNAAGEAEMVITINGVEYTEADTAVPASGVWTNGASPADSATSLIAAINGDTRAAVPFTAVADESGDGVWLFADDAGDDVNLTIATDSASNCTVQNLTGGADAEMKQSISIVHTVNTQELLSGAIEIPIPFTPRVVHASAYTATGAPVYFTDLVTIEEDPDRIKIATDGATNLANTNVLHLTVVS